MSCCHFSDFEDDFSFYFKKQFGRSHDDEELKKAKADWRVGSTGWESVQIAKERIDAAVRKADELELVNIGGKNYAYQGSDLAIKYGKAVL